MCECLTSHLFDLQNRKMLVHTIYGHSETRAGLGLSDFDGNVVEVEWLEQAAEPYIRWDGSRADEDERQSVHDWYAKRFPTRQSLVKECLRRGVVIEISQSSELDGVTKLTNCTRLRCYCCTGLTKLPELPSCVYLHCDGCSNLTELPELPKCTHLHCTGCSNLTELPELPSCVYLSCDDRLKPHPNKETPHD